MPCPRAPERTGGTWTFLKGTLMPSIATCCRESTAGALTLVYGTTARGTSDVHVGDIRDNSVNVWGIFVSER